MLSLHANFTSPHFSKLILNMLGLLFASNELRVFAHIPKISFTREIIVFVIRSIHLQIAVYCNELILASKMR